MKTCFLAIPVIALAVSGCGNFNSIHRTLDTASGQGILIDIKQRAILASTMRDSSNPAITFPVVCAEPSPDSLSAYAFDLAAQGNLPTGKALSGTLGTAESAAFVGLRTPTIQLLRDQLFRTCEAYINKAITAAEYNLAHRRFQKQTVALFAIDQLTRLTVAPAVVVGAAGMAQGSMAPFLQNVFTENNSKVKVLEKDRDTAGATDDQKKFAQAEIDRLNKQNSEILQSLKSAEPVKVSTSTSGEVTEQKPPATAGDILSIAKVVEIISDGFTQTDDFMQICIAKFDGESQVQAASPSPGNKMGNTEPNSMREACMRRMGIANDGLRIQNETTQLYLTSIVSDNTLTPAEKRNSLQNLLSSGTTDPGMKTKQQNPFLNNGTVTMQGKFSKEQIDAIQKALQNEGCDPKKDKGCSSKK